MNRLLSNMIGITCLSLSVVSHAENGLPWSSGFESGNFSDWTGSAYSPLPEIVDQGCYEGRLCSRSVLQNGTENVSMYVNHHFGDFHNIGLEKVEEVYLKFHVKIGEGYSWPTGSDTMKVALINLTDGNTSARRYQVYIYVDSQGHYVVDHSYIDSWRFFGLGQNIGQPASVALGSWDELKLHVRLNDPGSANGIVRLWVNGALKVEYTDVNLRENTSYGMGRLILSSQNGGQTGGNGYIYHDAWSLTETDPDQLSSPPSPPVMNQN